MGASKNRHGKWFFVTVILVSVIGATLASLTLYVASTPVSHMSVVTQDAALKSVRYYHNATQVFSSDNTQWLLVPQFDVVGIQSEYIAIFYIFKVAGNDGRDFSVIGIDPTLNGTSVVDDQLNRVYYYPNNTVMSVSFHFSGPGTYIIDLGLKLRVYSTVLYLPIVQEDIRVATDLRVRYG